MFKNRELSSPEKLFVIVLCICLGFLCNALIIGTLYQYMQGEIAYKILLVLSSVLTFGLPAVAAAALIGSEKNPFAHIRLTSNVKISKFLIVIVFMLSIIPAIEFVASLNASYSFPESIKGIEEYLRSIDASAMEATQRALAGSDVGMFVLNLVALAITPAICEEMFFRGVMQKFFVDNIRNKHIAILLTAFIFSAIHMQFSGLLPRFILGAVLGYLFYSSGSLWLSIVAHATNNALVVIAAFIFGAEVSASPDLSAYANPWWICAIVAGLAIAFFAGRKIFHTKK
jgi:CAAX amino terminal protease family.